MSQIFHSVFLRRPNPLRSLARGSERCITHAVAFTYLEQHGGTSGRLEALEAKRKVTPVPRPSRCFKSSNTWWSRDQLGLRTSNHLFCHVQVLRKRAHEISQILSNFASFTSFNDVINHAKRKKEHGRSESMRPYKPR